MGATWSSSGPRDSQRTTEKREAIIAAALSAAFGETVVTKQEYDRRRKDEPGFGINAESLDLRCYEKMCYESVKIQYGDVFGKEGDPIAVTVIVKNLPEQPSYKLSSIGDRSYMKAWKSYSIYLRRN